MKNKSKRVICLNCCVEFEVVTEPMRGEHEADETEAMFIDGVMFCPVCARHIRFVD